MKVMVIAGTKDAKEIISKLAELNIDVVATVTTKYGKELLEIFKGVQIVMGKLDASDMEEFLCKNTIDCLVDASHPFAKDASINAIKASSNIGVPYIRYERQELNIESDKIIRVKDFQAAAEACCRFKENILLTIGSNNLKPFVESIADKSRLFARVLPDSRMVLKCEEAGLTADNIIAIKGPFSVEMNIAILKHCKASVMVTKESGEAGGTCEKLEAAKQLDILVIMVERPQVSYGIMVHSIEEVLKFVRARDGH